VVRETDCRLNHIAFINLSLLRNRLFLVCFPLFFLFIPFNSFSSLDLNRHPPPKTDFSFFLLCWPCSGDCDAFSFGTHLFFHPGILSPFRTTNLPGSLFLRLIGMVFFSLPSLCLFSVFSFSPYTARVLGNFFPFGDWFSGVLSSSSMQHQLDYLANLCFPPRLRTFPAGDPSPLLGLFIGFVFSSFVTLHSRQCLRATSVPFFFLRSTPFSFESAAPPFRPPSVFSLVYKEFSSPNPEWNSSFS